LQGATEFKTEIELLSRVHHRNVVHLDGFCYDKGEQMLIYEYVPNGSLRAALSGTCLILHLRQRAAGTWKYRNCLMLPFCHNLCPERADMASLAYSWIHYDNCDPISGSA